MINRKTVLIVLSTLIIGLISGCTSTAGAASSWPGITVVDDTGYFAYGASVYSIDLKNGNQIWHYPSEPNAKTQFYAAPFASEDMVFAGSYDNTLAALDKSNGSKKWVFSNALDRYIASPLVVGDKVFAPNSDKYLYALNTSGDLLWKFKTSAPNWTRPVSDDKFVYLASMDHFLYAFDLEYKADSLVIDKNGSLTLLENPLWSVDLGSAVVADPVLNDGNVLVATIDGKLHNINTSTRKTNWTFVNDNQYSSVWGAPVIFDNAVFFATEKGDVYALDLKSGDPLWAEPYATEQAIIAGGVALEDSVLFVNNSGKLFTIDREKVAKSIKTLDMVMYATPKKAGDTILLAPAAKEKLFMAIDLVGNEIWSFIPSK
jgi:outer membrane protein assembly factor BamB